MEILTAAVLYSDEKLPFLLQSPTEWIVTFSCTKDDSVPDFENMIKTKRGSSFIMTAKGSKTAYSAFKSLVDGWIPTIAFNSYIHAPFVSDQERSEYGKRVIKDLSIVRTKYVTKQGKNVMDEIMSHDNLINQHVHIVQDGTFVLLK